MPPKPKVTEEMIVDAAVEVVRQSDFERINARTVSGQLHCSTQPVMYHFSTIENLKKAAYRHVDHLHSEYMMNTPPGQDPILGIGLNYVRFAMEEPQLFRFLFQSGYAEEKSLLEMVDSEELAPVLEAMREGAGLSLRKTRNVFITSNHDLRSRRLFCRRLKKFMAGILRHAGGGDFLQNNSS